MASRLKAPAGSRLVRPGVGLRPPGAGHGGLPGAATGGVPRPQGGVARPSAHYQQQQQYQQQVSEQQQTLKQQQQSPITQRRVTGLVRPQSRESNNSQPDHHHHLEPTTTRRTVVRARTPESSRRGARVGPGQGPGIGGPGINRGEPVYAPQAQQPHAQPVSAPVHTSAPPHHQQHQGDTGGELQVGDRVLVGGSKPGVVAFLGQTQFARGVWAGVVLDSYEGKNDGSVNGVQYFQCEPQRGLFARPEKLLCVPPLEDSGSTQGGRMTNAAMLPAVSSSTGGGASQYLNATAGVIENTHPLASLTQNRHSGGGAAAPTSGVGEGGMAVGGTNPPGPGPNPPISLALRQMMEKFALGDRVLVGGAKEGYLRFLGPTEFAKGIWAGIELEEPMGKNNGAVSGKRYFQCPPKHGLFAPLPRIEKLASPGRQTDGVHIPPISVETSSPGVNVSSVHQHQQQQQQHSPLMRRLSNSSTTSTGSTNRSQLLDTVPNLKAALEVRENEKRQLEDSVTELKRKVEDLQFRLEEQGVISGDQLETAAENSQQRVKDLEQSLKVEKVQSSKKISELKKEVGSLKDVLESQKQSLEQQCESEIERLRDGQTLLEEEKLLLEERVNELTLQLESREEEEGGGQVAEVSIMREQFEKEKQQLEEELLQARRAQDSLVVMEEEKLIMEERMQELTLQLEKEQKETASREQDVAVMKESFEQEKLDLLQQVEAAKALKEEYRFLEEEKQVLDETVRELSVQLEQATESQTQENDVQKMKQEVAVMQERFERTKTSLEEKLELASAGASELQQRMEHMRSEREFALQEAQNMADKLKTTQEEKAEMQAVLDSTRTRSEELEAQLDELNDSLKHLQQNSGVETAAVQQRLDSVEETLNLRERQLAEAKETITGLTEELAVREKKLDFEEVEEEKAQLEIKLRETEAQLNSVKEELIETKAELDYKMEEMEEPSASVQALTMDLQQAQEQIYELQGQEANLQQTISEQEHQIQSLNVVVNELQRKLESAETLAHAGYRETSMSTSYADEEEDPQQQFLPPPRLFCDICDIFDEHDTDDCPRQAASDSSPPPPPPLTAEHASRRALGGSDRPYCESCEVFGHWTQDCQFEDTY